jgi:hypothetical protein
MLGLLSLLGVVELLFPRRLVDFWMRFLVEDGEDVTVRPWAYSLVRLEGIVILLWAARRRRRKQDARAADAE